MAKSLLDIEFMRDCQLPALVIDGHVTHYDELYQKACRMASWIFEAKVKSVAIVISRQLPDYVALLACLLTGKQFVPIHPKWTAERQRQVMALTGAVCPPNTIETASHHQTNSFDLHQIAYVVFTSGSTGQPKGVPISFANLLAYLSACLPHLTITQADRVAQYADLSFDMGLHDAYCALLSGACLYVVPSQSRLAPFRFIRDNHITVWFSLPSVASLGDTLKALPNNSLPSLRLTLFSGEALYKHQAKVWLNAAANTRLINSYGPSEHTVACCYFELTRQTLLTQPDIVCIGKPIGDTMAALYQKTWDNTRGELCLAGPQLTSGYLGDAYANRFSTMSHPQYGSQRFYKSGDLCSLDAEGNYHFLGRLDNQIKINGQFVSLDALDACLTTLCKARVTAVVHNPKASMQKILCLFINTSSYDESCIRHKAADILQDNQVPIRLIFIEKIPLTANDKVDRHALMQLIKS